MPFVFVALLVCTSALAQSLPSLEASSGDIAASHAAQPSVSQEPDTSTDHVSLGGLIRDLGRNFRDLPSLETASILGVGGGMSAWVRSEDAEITHRWSGSPQLDEVFEPGGAMGSGWGHVGGAVGTYVLGRAIDSPRTALLGADLIRSQTINAVLTQGIKVAVRRQRPDGDSFSFPSGHASATFTTATVLQRHFGWKVGVPSYAVAMFVGGSRLQENRHYLSDVLFGAAIGIVSGRTATIGRHAATFSLSPVVAPGTVGFSLTHRTHR
jgi:membrane-associated phospholipid phosphatase